MTDEEKLYFFSIPFSILVIIPLYFKFFNYLISNAFFLIILSICIFSILLKIIFHEAIDFNLIKNISYILLFVSSLKIFEAFFIREFSKRKDVNFNEEKFLLTPFKIILILTILSTLYQVNSSHKYDTYAIFVFETFRIYNYEQYFGFIFILFLGTLVRQKNYFLPLYFFLVTYLILNSINLTAFICTIFFVIIYLMKFFFKDKEYIPIIFFGIIIIFLYFLFFPIILVAIDLFVLDLFNSLGLQISNSLIYRSFHVSNYFSNFEWYQIFFPFLSELRSTRNDMHNELLEVFNSIGFIGLVIYYFNIFRSTMYISRVYIMPALAISLVCFLGGTMVNNTLHPYIAIILSYYISFYIVSFRNQNII
tara:strand:- start:20 stop:1114 length:1095 start_codon:yes stop_codon:yes gene_type:complete